MGISWPFMGGAGRALTPYVCVAVSEVPFGDGVQYLMLCSVGWHRSRGGPRGGVGHMGKSVRARRGDSPAPSGAGPGTA